MGQTFKIARVGLHHFEEPCISGEKGSGTIFFSGCTMRCLFCQNHQISHGGVGREITPDQLIKCMKYLEGIGAENINLVTPPANINLLVETLKEVKKDLSIPIVWNSNGYETVKNLENSKDLLTFICRTSNIVTTIWARSFQACPTILMWLRKQLPKCAVSNPTMSSMTTEL
jgi:putative pyruvate formate lyase activating enzyme